MNSANENPAFRLSYSTNVHPAAEVADLLRLVREEVAPICRDAFGEKGTHYVNLHLRRRTTDALLGRPRLPSTSILPDEFFSASPAPACEELTAALRENGLEAASINAFPVLDFHAARVKELVYSPPWTDGGRALAAVKTAKVFAQLLPDERAGGALSVPTGTFKGYADHDEIKEQCAHFLTEAVVDLVRLERAVGKTMVLGLEPEPYTTAETLSELLDYFKRFLLPAAAAKFPARLGVNAGKAEEIARRFLTVNLDICHQAVEFEDPREDLRALNAAGITVSGLHLSAAPALSEPGKNADGWEMLRGLDEPRNLHQVVARRRTDGRLLRFPDLPALWEKKGGETRLEEFDELCCHFHVPLHVELRGAGGALRNTREAVGPAARFALENGLTDNLVVETYTWPVLAAATTTAATTAGKEAARALLGGGEQGKFSAADLRAGLAAELRWAAKQLRPAPPAPPAL